MIWEYLEAPCRRNLLDNFFNFKPLKPEMEFKEFEPWFKSAKTRFKLNIWYNFKWNQP